MNENKKEVAQEVPTQEQLICKTKDLQTFAFKIFCQFCGKNISIDDAKEVLKMCSELIDLNSQIVVAKDQVIVWRSSQLSE